MDVELIWTLFVEKIGLPCIVVMMLKYNILCWRLMKTVCIIMQGVLSYEACTRGTAIRAWEAWGDP